MKSTRRSLSPYAATTAVMLGQLIRTARIKQRMSMLDVAERAGISRALLRRIETGDPSTALGSAFEVATIVGLKLFDAGQSTIAKAIDKNREALTLLPKAVRNDRLEVKDDF